MNKETVKYLQTIEDSQIAVVASRLALWLGHEMTSNLPSSSRARALLIATNALDEPTLGDFARTLENVKSQRIALGDLIDMAGIDPESIGAIPSTTDAPAISWLALILAAFAWKVSFPIEELDPTSPPAQFSPAGQIVHQSAQFIRKQTQRSATERDKAARRLAFRGRPQSAESHPQPEEPVGRVEIPVRHYEFNDEVTVERDDTANVSQHLSIGREEALQAPPTPTPSNTLRITEDDLAEPPPTIRVGPSRVVQRPNQPQRPSRPRVNIDREKIGRTVATGMNKASSFLEGLRKNFASEEMTTSKLRVTVHEFPQADGLPGVQIAVRHEHSKNSVAGLTSDRGVFLCSLPVRVNGDLTYHVDVTWPPTLGGHTERKSITINSSRSEFNMPFFLRLTP